jgi:hypothetical protein
LIFFIKSDVSGTILSEDFHLKQCAFGVAY